MSNLIPSILIPLDWFLDLACVDQVTGDSFTTVDATLAQQIKTVDPQELLTHIEPVEGSGDQLFQIYPIKNWRESLLRRTRLKARAEIERQQRFEIEQSILDNQKKILRKRELFTATIVYVNRHHPGVYHLLTRDCKTDKQKYDTFEYFIFRALNGENMAIARKFGISEEDVIEFKSLPHDPQWTNPLYNPPEK
jgi:hypothetical protein